MPYLPFADVLSQDPFVSALAQAVALVLLVRFLDIWEREPLWVVGLLVLWGMLGATALALSGNGLVTGLLSKDVEIVWGPAISAPIVEELAKGLGLIAAVWASSWAAKRTGVSEFDGPLDGIVYGVSIGIGFAFAENLFYADFKSPDGSIEGGVDVLHARQGFLGLMMLGHGVYTSCLGAGIGMAVWARTRAGRIGWALGGLGLAMFFHALWNGLFSVVMVGRYGFDATATALSGGELPVNIIRQMENTNEQATTALTVLAYVLIALLLLVIYLLARYEQRIVVYELAPEVNSGLITEAELRNVTSFWRRLGWYFQLFREGKFEELGTVRRAHARLVDLGFWKWRVRRTGTGDEATERRRARIRSLRQQATARTT